MGDARTVKRDVGNVPDDAETPEGIGIIKARETLGELVSRVAYGNERFVLSKHGKQVAALVSVRDYERLRELDGAA